ncbi:MAG: hypothetical protein L0H79_12850 [Intrasporangium sp.]|uniref:hypothetical protein n=1 Tax=Intrasporangium sp. TaxID=1925024 RepID=UPI002649C166|nr:hypothetical protein [Intrasporangium sp.]MDN5796629.1 hypothetical protein [Intrasporangium sp.]
MSSRITALVSSRITVRGTLGSQTPVWGRDRLPAQPVEHLLDIGVDAFEIFGVDVPALQAAEDHRSLSVPDEVDDRLARASDRDLLAGEHLLDEPGELGLGLVEVDLDDHTSTMVEQVWLSQPRDDRGITRLAASSGGA